MSLSSMRAKVKAAIQTTSAGEYTLSAERVVLGFVSIVEEESASFLADLANNGPYVVVQPGGLSGIDLTGSPTRSIRISVYFGLDRHQSRTMEAEENLIDAIVDDLKENIAND